MRHHHAWTVFYVSVSTEFHTVCSLSSFSCQGYLCFIGHFCVVWHTENLRVHAQLINGPLHFPLSMRPLWRVHYVWAHTCTLPTHQAYRANTAPIHCLCIQPVTSNTVCISVHNFICLNKHNECNNEWVLYWVYCDCTVFAHVCSSSPLCMFFSR